MIHVIGLSVGIASCVIILPYVNSELSYDRFNTKADRIVRVVFKADVGGQKIGEANVMPPVAATIKSSFPEVRQDTRLVAGVIFIALGTICGQALYAAPANPVESLRSE